MHARLALLVALLTACSDRSASMKQPLSPDVENIRLSPDGEDLKRAQECVPPLCHDHDACAREAIAEITALTCKPLANSETLCSFLARTSSRGKQQVSMRLKKNLGRLCIVSEEWRKASGANNNVP
jgi:hypothetical protein